ncbi:MAG: right-handed parallel beta-helix repeat-containing protein [Actinobacteria bacterium]|nr:MAG: right-handed parallel beta-helix repeat-containing protein [Actinomycetota bacterium]
MGGTSRGSLVVVLALALLAPAAALAHVERTSYWPDPRPDASVKPPAGGDVPKARSLASALQRKQRGTTRVVCLPDSLATAKADIAAARTKGYQLRPTAPVHHITRTQARTLLSINRRLFARCAFHEIQPAVTASRNNDRVVIMPGVYTEPTARAVPAFPKECDQYRITSENGSGAVSYAYQFHCPNAQSLVGLAGHALGPGQDPPVTPTGRPDPHGIPNLGPCIRCNMQIEGSGPSPDDVVLDAGRVESGNGAPLGSKKDVGLRADRADGIVLRNFTVRHAAEHDVYIHETDGYLVDHMKFFYAGEYGELMFASDHGLTQNCDAVGSGDSGIYPGGAADTGTLRDTTFYPEFRLNQTITHCDIHHNNMGTSGTMGNAVHYVENNIYGNGAGFVTDSFYAGGHPGFPQDSTVYERNRVYSNNFNVYGADSDVKSAVAIPIGVGALIAGGDDNVVRDNYIYDNWRRGTMLLAVPDVIACAPSPDEGAPPCAPKGLTQTSNGNRYYNNVMGRSPDGEVMPNGVDFWWDQFPSNTGNCWYSNIGPDGTTGSVTADPPTPPQEGTSIPGFLPEDCGAPTNVGTGNPQKEAVLVACAANFSNSSNDDPVCDWFQPPAEPGSPEAARQKAQQQAAAQRLVGRALNLPRFCELVGGQGGTLTCGPFRDRV